MEAKVFDQTGKDTGNTVKLSDEVFGITPNEHAIYLDVKQYRANLRQGTHKSKERADITGSGKKIKKQKGTGTARAGSIKSPIFRGGGRVFGPRPRNYSFKINKKVKRLARASALSQKFANQQIVVVEDFDFDQPKTKEFKKVLDSLKIADKKSIFAFGEPNKNVYLSSRNLEHNKVLNYSQLNTYNILDNNILVLSLSALEKLESNLKDD
ncbi:MAG: 50S ribosomal protein L4 [Psychroflexus sp.]|nr:50S ribosomal protein L4 [Psychroflexus sp.]MDR9447661.1 50S ribosomal protein L4 [Psychroflexus sp.]